MHAVRASTCAMEARTEEHKSTARRSLSSPRTSRCMVPKVLCAGPATAARDTTAGMREVRSTPRLIRCISWQDAPFYVVVRFRRELRRSGTTEWCGKSTAAMSLGFVAHPRGRHSLPQVISEFDMSAHSRSSAQRGLGAAREQLARAALAPSFSGLSEGWIRLLFAPVRARVAATAPQHGPTTGHVNGQTSELADKAVTG